MSLTTPEITAAMTRDLLTVFGTSALAIAAAGILLLWLICRAPTSS